MSDTVNVEFTDIKVGFGKSFVRQLLTNIFPKQKTFHLHAEGVKTLQQTADLLYNNGKGDSLFFSVATLSYGLGLHVHNDMNGIRVAFSVDEHSVIGEKSGQVIPDLIERCKSAYLCIHPSHGRGDFGLIFDRYGTDVNARAAYKWQVFWLNFYGPKMVGEIGTDRFSSVPYGRVEYLTDGGVLLVRGKTPSENHKYSDLIREHLFGRRSLADRILGR